MLSELQEQAKFLHESCQLEQALPIYAQLYSLALSSNQLSSELLDDYAELCTSLGNLDQSRKLYTQSIQMFPNVNSSKYFALAQICTSEESISLYTKGILLSTDQEKPQVASAYSAMAEIYMTDLW